jgi:hypothetical protein
LASCFKDSRHPAYTEHSVETLVMQRVVGIALGYTQGKRMIEFYSPTGPASGRHSSNE